MRKLYISISWESRQNRCDKVAPVGSKRLPPVVTIAILNLSFRIAAATLSQNCDNHDDIVTITLKSS